MQLKLLVLQPTSLCNLDCAYCYVPGRSTAARMDDTILDRVFALTFASKLVGDEVEFLWHAGEPLTVGIAYYQRALELIARHNSRGVKVTNTIQTNGTLITADWARFLLRHDFGVGVSIDGPAAIHDRQRTRWSGAGSHQATLRGILTLREHGIRPGALCVLTRETLAHPDEVFDFFFSNGFDSLAFNLEEAENAHPRSSLQHDTGDGDQIVQEYRDFMSRFWDLWWPHRAEMLIREFHDFAAVFAATRDNHNYCRPLLETQPLAILTIQRNGDITPYSPELAGSIAPRLSNFVIGNVGSVQSLDDLRFDQNFGRIASEVERGRTACRKTCAFFAVCGGGFQSNRFTEHGTFAHTETMACLLHRQVLATVMLDKLVARQRKQAVAL